MNNKAESLVDLGGVWFPEKASTFAGSVDIVFYFILILSIIFFIAIVAAVFYFIHQYKRTKDNPKATAQIVHNTRLELTWTIVPTILVMIIFYWGYKEYLKMSTTPSNALEVNIIGKQWFWEFEYPKHGVKTINEMVVPVNKPIKLIMTSHDVLHSFFIPNFRTKRDLVPNKYTVIWFEATKTGNFQIFCTEYCGDSHSNMIGIAKVVSHEEFQEWVSAGAGDADKELPLAELGKKLYQSKACFTCHSVDGSTLVGPSWKGLYGKKRTFSNAKPTTADENYIRESIVYPANKIVTGFQNVMPTYASLLSDRENDAIIEYIKTLK